MKTTNSILHPRDYEQLDVDYLEVLVDPEEQVIGLMAHPHRGKPFIMPLDMGCARKVCTSLMKTITATAELK